MADRKRHHTTDALHHFTGHLLLGHQITKPPFHWGTAAKSHGFAVTLFRSHTVSQSHCDKAIAGLDTQNQFHLAFNQNRRSAKDLIAPRL